MATSSFSDTPEVPQNPAPAPVSSELVPANASAPAVAAPPDSFFTHDDLVGEFDRKDFKLPRINVVHGVGELSKTYDPGVLLFNGDTILKQPVRVVLAKLRKYFVEDLPYSSDKIPRYAQTSTEVYKLGAYLISEKNYRDPSKNAGKAFFRPAVEATLFIKGTPETVAFPFEFEGTPYALAIMTFSKSAYERCGKTFITAAGLGLRHGLTQNFWELSTKRETIGDNQVWIPRASLVERTPPAFAQFAKDLLG